MGRPFDSVSVVGVGLIGGSLCAALRSLPDPPAVTGVEPDAPSRALALARGIVDKAVAPEEADEALLGADLVVLATPARAAGEWLRRLGDLGYRGVVTDVASTKSGIVAEAARVLPKGCRFIGGHPMAGSERSGVEFADGDLFRGGYYVLTPSPEVDADAYRRLHALITSIGARVIAIPPHDHDEAVAAISHIPHIAASGLTNVASARARTGDEVLRLAAGGFKDMTRIAAGSPDLWTGICFDNREAVSRALVEYGLQLTDFSRMLEEGDRDGVRSWLERAATVRRSLPARWVPASEQLHELSVPIFDRPGAVGAVAQAAARAGCNIEDIGIDHTTEDTAVLRVVLTDEGDFASLVADLRSLGFEPVIEPLGTEGGGT